MGFRSYIRHFLVAILMLFRPSGPCCLSVAEAPFLSCFWSQFWYFSVLQGPAVWAWRRRRFWAWKLGSFWSQFCRFSVLHCHGVFPSGSCLLNFWTDPGRRKGERVREEDVLHCYYFWSQFWCFSVLQGPAVWAWRRRRFWAWKFPSGSCLLNRRSSKSRSSSSSSRRKK